MLTDDEKQFMSDAAMRYVQGRASSFNGLHWTDTTADWAFTVARQMLHARRRAITTETNNKKEGN